MTKRSSPLKLALMAVKPRRKQRTDRHDDRMVSASCLKTVRQSIKVAIQLSAKAVSCGPSGNDSSQGMLDYVQDGEAMAARPKQNALCLNLRVGNNMETWRISRLYRSCMTCCHNFLASFCELRCSCTAARFQASSHLRSVEVHRCSWSLTWHHTVLQKPLRNRKDESFAGFAASCNSVETARLLDRQGSTPNGLGQA